VWDGSESVCMRERESERKERLKDIKVPETRDTNIECSITCVPR